MADFEMNAGTDFTINVSVMDAIGEPLTITGGTIVWVATTAWWPGGNTITKRTADGTIVFTNPSVGEFAITLAQIDTAMPGTQGGAPIIYAHEARLTLNNVSEVIMTGRMTVIPSYTYGVT